MKILMLGWELPPHNSGGMGVACYQMCEALSSMGVSIEFVVPYEAEHGIPFMQVTAAQPLKADDVRLIMGIYDSKYFISDGNTENWLSSMEVEARYVKAVEKIAVESSFDVIHAHDWLTCRAALRAKELSGKPLIVHIHALEADRAGKPGAGNSLVREIEYLALTLADRIVAVSERTKQLIMSEYDVPADKINVIHNSIDASALQPLDPDNAYRYLEQMKNDGYKVVANIGRFTLQKNIPNLLHSFRAVVDKLPKTILLLVGNGDQFQELIHMSATLGLSKNVIFTDFQRGKNVRDGFAIADLFVMPSVSEPFGLTPLEAIGYGTPSLISYQSGVAEVLKNCLKVDFWDTREMANQIVGALENPALLEEMRVQAKNELEHLTWDNSARKLIDTYRLHLGSVLT